MHKILSLLFFSTLIISHSVFGLDYETIEKKINEYESKIQNIEKNIDHSVFDETEILLNLDFDADNIIAFTKEKIAFHPYNGLLRGINGTLNSRAGNALDQSLLLAKLLKDAGFDAKIANGILTDKQAKTLLKSTSKAVIPNHIGVNDDFQKSINSITNQSVNKNKDIKKIDLTQTETYKRYNSNFLIVDNVLQKNGVKFKSNNIESNLIAQNKNYFWVQFRMNPTEDWNNAHPAFSKDKSLDIEVVSTFKDKVPAKYLHQVKIEAFIQQKIGDKYQTHSLMNPWIKPASNLQDFLITFNNSPAGLSKSSEYNIENIVKSANFFTPRFNGKSVGGKVFDLKGRLIDAEAMNSQAGALFQTLGDKTLSAINKIENKKDNENHLKLTAQWLQFTFIHPNGDEFVQKRYIYQENDKDNQNDDTIKLQLLSEYSLLVNTGEHPESYLAKVYLDMITSSIPLLKSSSKEVFSDDKNTRFPKALPRNAFDLMTQYYLMNKNPSTDKETIRFRSNANMIGFKRGFVNQDTAYFAVDIIANKQEFIKIKNDQFLSNPNAAFQQGVWETANESIPSRILGLEGNSLDTLKVMQESIDQKIELSLYKSSDADLQKLKKKFEKNTSLFNKMKSDLNQGYVIVMPSEIPENVLMTGWWRINPLTGETLGMIGNGGGSEVTEYLIQNAAIALSIVRAIGNLKKCEAKTNDLEKLCCLAEAHFNNVAGLAFGGMLGGVLGTAGAAMFDIADFTTELATEAIAGSGNGVGISPASTQGKLCAGIDFPDF